MGGYVLERRGPEELRWDPLHPDMGGAPLMPGDHNGPSGKRGTYR